MKIAIPTRGQTVDNHFGHCEMYTLLTVDENKQITRTDILPSPQGCGCKSDIASVLKQTGVEVMLAGGIGDGAINVLTRHGIKVVRGCSGNVNALAALYLSGNLKDSGESCSEHGHHQEDGHSCQH